MNKNKLPSLIPILVLTLMTVITWVSVDVYLAFNKKPQITVSEGISQPLTPSLDQDTINKLESHNYLDDSQIPEVSVGSSPSPTPIATIARPTLLPKVASGSGTTP